VSDVAKGLYPKLVAAIAEVERIGKDGTNEHFKYTYTSAEQVYRVIRDPLLRHGLVVIPSIDTFEQNGKLTVSRLHLTIVDSESGEKHEAFWMGEGQDSGDKGSYKAATGGMKTWLKHLFMLPADDDPEADPSTDREPARELTGLEKLAAAADKADMPGSKRKIVGGWLHPDGETLDEGRLNKALERIGAGDVDGLITQIQSPEANGTPAEAS